MGEAVGKFPCCGLTRAVARYGELDPKSAGAGSNISLPSQDVEDKEEKEQKPQPIDVALLYNSSKGEIVAAYTTATGQEHPKYIGDRNSVILGSASAAPL